MSKRVLIILAVGFIAIIVAFFLMKHECSQVEDLEYHDEPEPEEKPRKSKKLIKDEKTEEPAATAAEPGTEPGTTASNE